MRKASLGIIFLTVFIDLIGFGLVLPLLPNYSKGFGASGLEVGLIMAAYSLMQFIFAPAWGALSDRVGRRPVLLVSTAGAAVSYAVFAYGSTLSGRTALGVILISRLVAGICGALIGYSFVSIQCHGACSTPEGAGAIVGAVIAAVGVAVVAVLVLRAMGEWKTITQQRALEEAERVAAEQQAATATDDPAL